MHRVWVLWDYRRGPRLSSLNLYLRFRRNKELTLLKIENNYILFLINQYRQRGFLLFIVYYYNQIRQQVNSLITLLVRKLTLPLCRP